MNEPMYDWGSRCAECGRVMPAGQQQRCAKGGWCSHYIPAAVRDALEDLYDATARLVSFGEEVEDKALVGHEGCLWPVEIGRAAIAKAEGKLNP